MGRAFEFRKGRKMKRWDQMSKAFTKYGKEISMAVKAGGPDPTLNARLRVVIQNAKGVNMPKDRIESAIKRASDKSEKDFEEIVYEGYGPKGVGIVIEAATDNPNRTVANIRSYFSRGGGELGKTGSLEFMFERLGLFTVAAEGLDTDELELDLIDFGLQDIEKDEAEIIITTSFADFGKMQKALEERNINIINAELQRIPTSYADVTAEDRAAIEKMLEKIEEDEDIQNVFHNMKPEEE
ncbi:YebC/PmpR family DNA-binding transcriptional regulator [Oscillatoria amoena NRMC-F 0135]|nr:YebC/PmpR family DNA-binding transcriptional regulator [Oscillatoria amoena NRMC-F 0135]